MSALAAPSGRLRWSLSAGLVLGAHVAVGALLVSRAVVMTPDPPPPAAVMIDMAPEPTPEPAPPPPPPPQAAAVETPPDPVPPPPEILHTEPAVALPKPPPPPPKPVHHKAPPPVTPPAVTAAQPSPATSDAPPAPVQSAAAPGPVAPPAPPASNAKPSYLGQLAAHLARYKPRTAHAQGTVLLAFTIDREGHVLSFHIDRSSGHSVLDDAVTQMIERAQPLPAMPPEMPDAQLSVTLPVEFSLR